MIPYVVDASVAIKWFVEEEHSAVARLLLEDEFELSAPDLWWPECCNILWKKVQRGELTAQEARLIRGGLEQQNVAIFPSSLIIEPALEIALETGRSVYDSCYLALALLTKSHLVTADLRLHNSLQMTNYITQLIFIADLA